MLLLWVGCMYVTCVLRDAVVWPTGWLADTSIPPPPSFPQRQPHHQQVQNTIPLGMGGQVVLVSHRRIKIDGPLGVGPPLRVKVRE